MTTIIQANIFIYLIVGGIAVFKGLNLKKWSSWLLGAYGFISGFLVGFLRSDQTGGYYLGMNLTGSLQMGALFAFMILFGGATSRWHWQRFAK